ncbi:hypothetical protein MF646_17415 [Halalkalibacter sp. MEB205]|uniref:Uncharacterized protein n=1 Tax=Halalkalibacter alkaliphilus TaxID=2917993 RepID=A0A9X2I8J2_9BACI|nr:hypothetical protein [Halalkalibacter alkaliphilus]
MTSAPFHYENTSISKEKGKTALFQNRAVLVCIGFSRRAPKGEDRSFRLKTLAAAPLNASISKEKGKTAFLKRAVLVCIGFSRCAPKGENHSFRLKTLAAAPLNASISKVKRENRPS